MALSQGSTGAEQGLVDVAAGSFSDEEITGIQLQEPTSTPSAESECSPSQEIPSVSSEVVEEATEPNQFEETKEAVRSTTSAQGQTDNSQKSKAQATVKPSDSLGLRMLGYTGLDGNQILEFANGVPDNQKAKRLDRIYTLTLEEMNKEYKLSGTPTYSAMGAEWQRRCARSIGNAQAESYCKTENFFKSKAFYKSLNTVLNREGIVEDVNKFEGYQTVRRIAEERSNLFGIGQPSDLIRRVGR